MAQDYCVIICEDDSIIVEVDDMCIVNYEKLLTKPDTCPNINRVIIEWMNYILKWRAVACKTRQLDEEIMQQLHDTICKPLVEISVWES